MIVKTKNPILYQNTNSSNIETRGGYDGENSSSFISFEGDEFIPFDGQTDLDTFTGADGETYHYSFNNDEYYNAKGKKVGSFFKSIGKGIGKGAVAVGKGIGKGAKAIFKGIKFIGGKIVGKKRSKKIADNVKNRQDARKIKKDARKLLQFEVAKRKVESKKANTQFKKDKEIAELERKKRENAALYERSKKLALENNEKLAQKSIAQKQAFDEEIKRIKDSPLPIEEKERQLAAAGLKKINDDAKLAEEKRLADAKSAKAIEDAKAAAAAAAAEDARLKSMGLVAGGVMPPAGGYKTPPANAGTPPENAGTPPADAAKQPVVDFKVPLKEATADTKEENKVVINGKTYDNEGNKNVEVIKDDNGQSLPVLNVPTGDVVATLGTDGNVDYYQKKDVEGMTLTTKILIGVGAVIALGLVTFLINKRRK